MKYLLAAVGVWIAGFSAALAVEPDEVLADPALEARARALDKELRCVVCQSQSIDESNAPLAKDLRILVRERITAGDTDEEVIAYVVERYGDYVLLKPPVQSNTILLWVLPGVFLLVGGAAGFFFVRRMAADNKPDDLTDDERDALERALDERSQ